MSVGEAEFSDVLIIGAGISGIGAAYRIHEKNPQLRYAILERRQRLGGTWDLYRYPGIRSDSDIFTLCFPWEPWTRPEMIADGHHIWEYIADTAHKHGIDEHIRLNTYVRSADWDSTSDTWTVQTEHDGQPKTYRGRFLFFGTGYYNYDEPYAPTFPGIEDFEGEVVHPQHWPKDFDHTGKRLVVIGSGATAVSLIPSLTEKAAQVTMLQRTPSYMMSAMKVEPTANAIRKVFPSPIGHWIVRWRNAFVAALMWLVARKAPEFSKRMLRRIAERNLPVGYDIDTHFKPPYNPWDQRLCFIVGADLYKAISDGDVEMVTDHVDHMDAAGVVLKSGRHLDADVIITATGIQLQALGGITVSIDGEKVRPHDRYIYRRHLLEDVPNAAWCMGYTNASWTLGADLTAQKVAKLLAYMDSHGYTHAYPHLGDVQMPEQQAFNLQSGYVLRSLDVLPKSGTRRPWELSHNFLRDVLGRPFESIDESMVFGSVAIASAESAPSRAVGTRTTRTSS
jgi:cation diffusion facilitator CzcD-associated flavoprotein CzcO